MPGFGAVVRRVIPWVVCAAITACSPKAELQDDGRSLMHEWGHKPAGDIMAKLPPMARVCWGLHYGALTAAERGENDPLLAPDLRDTCDRSIGELDGACRDYAEAASNLGQAIIDTAEGSPERKAAEWKAELGFRRCSNVG